MHLWFYSFFSACGTCIGRQLAVELKRRGFYKRNQVTCPRIWASERLWITLNCGRPTAVSQFLSFSRFPSTSIGALVSDESPSSSISEWRCVAYITHKSDSKPTKNPTCARATGPQFSSGRSELRYLYKREREAESENCETKTKTYLSSGKCQQTSCAPNCQFEFNFESSGKPKSHSKIEPLSCSMKIACDNCLTFDSYLYLWVCFALLSLALSLALPLCCLILTVIVPSHFTPLFVRAARIMWSIRKSLRRVFPCGFGGFMDFSDYWLPIGTVIFVVVKEIFLGCVKFRNG